MSPRLRSSVPWLLVLVVGACAPATDEGVVIPVPEEAPITAEELAQGATWEGQDGSEPTEGIDGPLFTAPPLEPPAGSVNEPGIAQTVQAIAGCQPVTGYSHGRATRICVVRIEGALVEQRTAQAYLEMKSAASRSGVILRIVSGFRTMERQRYLYDCWRRRAPGCNLAAPPGYSNHQSGLALDLNTRDRGVYNWLASNGQRYGFRRTVSSEPWHWERPEGSQGPADGGGPDRGCYSHTLERNMGDQACVQSRFDERWYQCDDGVWYAGRGSHGNCVSEHPLRRAMDAPLDTRCYSSTQGRILPHGACVQSRLDALWYQCTNAVWLSASGSRGPAGSCQGAYPLR